VAQETNSEKRAELLRKKTGRSAQQGPEGTAPASGVRPGGEKGEAPAGRNKFRSLPRFEDLLDLQPGISAKIPQAGPVLPDAQPLDSTPSVSRDLRPNPAKLVRNKRRRPASHEAGNTTGDAGNLAAALRARGHSTRPLEGGEAPLPTPEERLADMMKRQAGPQEGSQEAAPAGGVGAAGDAKTHSASQGSHSSSFIEDEPDQREIEDEAFSDSPVAFPGYSSSRTRRSLRAVRALLLERRFTQALSVLILLVFASTLDVPWRDWFAKHAEAASRRVSSAMEAVTRPVQERAAYFITDDFRSGPEDWVNAGEAFEINEPGQALVRGFTLHEKTLHRVNYRMDFDARIQRRAVGWVVRAPDTENYYAFKLVEAGGSAGFYLQRWTVLAGRRDELNGTARVDVPDQLALNDTFNTISVRVRNDQITTLINGWGVDYWKDPRLARGGVGLFTDAGEAAAVRSFRISGNQDAWGKILWGTIETMKSLQSAVSGQAALALSPVPPGFAAELRSRRGH